MSLIVDAIHVDNKGIKIGNVWYNWSKFSNVVTEECIKQILSTIKKGDSVDFIGLSTDKKTGKYYYDNVSLVESVMQDNQKTIIPKVEDMEEKTTRLTKIAGMIYKKLKEEGVEDKENRTMNTLLIQLNKK